MNWKSFGPEYNGQIIGPEQWPAPSSEELPHLDDLCKFSNCTNVVVENLTIPASLNEDSLDAVRGENYIFRRLLVMGSTVIKGSIDGWCFVKSTLVGPVEVGQFDKYWYPGRPPTRGGHFIDCSYARVILWDATVPSAVDTRLEITKIPWIVWFPYFCFRWCWIRLFP